MDSRRMTVGLGRAIRARRESSGASQEGFADAVGLHRTYVGGIERGERNPSFANLCRIAEGLRVRLSVLLREAEAVARRL